MTFRKFKGILKWLKQLFKKEKKVTIVIHQVRDLAQTPGQAEPAMTGDTIAIH